MDGKGIISVQFFPNEWVIKEGYFAVKSLRK